MELGVPLQGATGHCQKWFALHTNYCHSQAAPNRKSNPEEGDACLESRRWLDHGGCVSQPVGPVNDTTVKSGIFCATIERKRKL